MSFEVKTLRASPRGSREESMMVFYSAWSFASNTRMLCVCRVCFDFVLHVASLEDGAGNQSG